MPAVAALLLRYQPAPDARLLFLVNLLTVLVVVVFAAAVIYLLLRRVYQRRVEEQRLAAMGTATARILHQIKNPLQTILLHADLLQDVGVADEPAARRELCGAIVGEAQRLASMLDELSVYASGARRQLSLEPFPLHSLLRELARRESREGQLRVDADEVEEALVPADPYYLRQALENLVANARDAMHGTADPRLVLRMRRHADRVEVEVADNGPGIPPERIGSIFEPFVSGKSKGMGLGLAICKEIVEAHHGRIEVQSRPGGGTVFRLLLPHVPEGAAASGFSVQGGAV